MERFPGMRTSIGGLLAVLLGFIAAVLSMAARIASRPRGGTSSSPDWSSARLAGAPRGLLLANDRVDVATREELAAAWRELGQTAHAAVAFAAQRSLELMALGAPPDLIAAAYEDAGDEVRHARICFAIARGIDGRDTGPIAASMSRRAFARARPVALAKLAAEIIVEGALAEGMSARMNAKLAHRTTDRAIRGALEEIASAEGRHAAHAWAAVEWCLREGGEVVEHALRSVVPLRARLPLRDVPQVALDGGWERWGIAGAALEQQELARTLATVDQQVMHIVERSTPSSGRLAAA